MFRSKKFCYKPHDAIYNWSTSYDRASPSTVSSPRLPKKKKEVKRLTFLCENYDSVWLKRFLKRSGSKQKIGKHHLKAPKKTQGAVQNTRPEGGKVDSVALKRDCLKVINYFICIH